jgi:hypothetical protein
MLRQRQRSLNESGVALNLIDTRPAKGQWYKADGTPLPNLLPIDPYHMRRYEKRGFTLIPPAVHEPVVAEEPDRESSAVAIASRLVEADESGVTVAEPDHPLISGGSPGSRKRGRPKGSKNQKKSRVSANRGT